MLCVSNCLNGQKTFLCLIAYMKLSSYLCIVKINQSALHRLERISKASRTHAEGSKGTGFNKTTTVV